MALYEIGKMYNDPGVSRLPNDGAAGFIARTLSGLYSLAEVSETQDMQRGSLLWGTCSSTFVHTVTPAEKQEGQARRTTMHSVSASSRHPLPL